MIDRNKTIIFSGMPGAGSTTVAKIISEKLKMNYFSPGRLFKDIGLGRLKQQYYYQKFKELCEAKKIEIPLLENNNDSSATMNFWQTEIGKSKQLHEAIDELQTYLAKQGNIVIDGKLSIRMIKEADFKIWLKADIKERSERTLNRDKITKHEILQMLKERESIERKEWKKIYGFDYFSQEEEANLVIDTTYLTPEEASEEIISKLNSTLSQRY